MDFLGDFESKISDEQEQSREKRRRKFKYIIICLKIQNVSCRLVASLLWMTRCMSENENC